MNEKVKLGDVCGYRKKVPIRMDLWKGCKAKEFNQPVFRPLASYLDLVAVKGQGLVGGVQCG